MKNDSHWAVEIRDVVDGLWVWRFENPFWKPGVDWEPLTTSTCVESGSEILVLDPQAPPLGAVEVWERLDAHPQLQLLFSSRITFGILICSCAATVPEYSVQDSSFATTFLRPELEPIEPGSHLPGGPDPSGRQDYSAGLCC